MALAFLGLQVRAAGVLPPPAPMSLIYTRIREPLQACLLQGKKGADSSTFAKVLPENLLP